MCASHLEVGHEVSEDRRAFLLQQVLQADDERNRVLNEGLLLDLWSKQGRVLTAAMFQWELQRKGM